MKNVSQERLKELKRIKNWILLVTVNGIESDKVVLSMDYLDDENDILEVFHDKNTYHIGKFGAYNAVHVQSEMGAVGRNASITTTDHAIKLWKPRAIIMIGVGWGADETKQKIGDVMVSKVVTSIEPAKITQGKTIQRARVQSRIGRRTPPRVVTQVGAMNAVAVRFKPDEQQGSGRDGKRPPQGGLPGAIDVVVFIHRWLAAQKDELVRVTPVAEGRHGVAA